MLYSTILRKLLWLGIFLSLNVTANEMTEAQAKERIVGNWRQYQTKMYEKENGEKVLKNEFIYEEQYRGKLKYSFNTNGTYSVVNLIYPDHSPHKASYKIGSDNGKLTITFINEDNSTTIPMNFEAELLVLGDDESFDTTFDNYFERVNAD